MYYLLFIMYYLLFIVKDFITIC